MAFLAFALRYWFFWNYPYPLMIHEQDGIAYMSIAKDLLAFRPPANLFMPPFYPFVIAVFSMLPFKLEIAARVAAISMDAITIIPLYGLSRIILPRSASAAVCFLWATFGFSLYYSVSPLSQSTYLCMLLWGTYLLYLALADSSRLMFFALSGVCLSAAYQTRPEGVVGLAAGILLIVAGACRKDADRRAHVRGGVVFFLVYLVTALPYLLMLRNMLGFWTFTAKTTVAIKGIDGSLTINHGAGAVKTGIALWLEHFGGVAGGIKHIVANIAGFSATMKRTFPEWVTWVALSGVPLLFLGRNFFNRLFLLLPFIVTLPVFVANLPKTHSYIYPLFPLCFIAFMAALRFIAAVAEKIARSAKFPGAAATFLFYAILLGSLPWIAIRNFEETTLTFTDPAYLHQVTMTNRLIKPAAEDLQRYSGVKDIVMTRWGLISYFAERPLMNMPKGSVADVLAAGRSGNAKFIVIDTESVETRRQELAPLLAPMFGKSIDPGLGIDVVSVGRSDVGGYVIYSYR